MMNSEHQMRTNELALPGEITYLIFGDGDCLMWLTNWKNAKSTCCVLKFPTKNCLTNISFGPKDLNAEVFTTSLELESKNASASISLKR